MMDAVFTALELTAPTWIKSYRSPPFEETFAPNNKICYRFPGTRYTAGDIDYYWYDTGPVDTDGWPVDGKKLPGDGSMLVGEKGYMFLPHGQPPVVLPREELSDAVARFDKEVGRPRDLDRYDQFLKRGKFPLGHISDLDHYHQFVDACLGRGATSTPFSYAGRLTESVLMGTIVNRFPEEKLLWDAKSLRFTNKPEANRYLRRDYRDGWHVEGLG